MGYIRLFIELKDSSNGNSGGQSRIEILDRSERGNRRYEIKVRLTAWGMEANQRCPVALISISRGRYKRYLLGEMQSGMYGRGEFSFRGMYEAASEPELGADYFNVIAIENGNRLLQGFRREATDWRHLKDVDAAALYSSESEPVQEAAAETEIMSSEETEPVQETEAEAEIMSPEETEPVQETAAEAETVNSEEAEPIQETASQAETVNSEETEPIQETASQAKTVNSEEAELIQETADVSEAVDSEKERKRAGSASPVLKYLFSQYRKVYPFQDISRRWIRIRLEDLSMLPPEAQELRNSSFVTRAYYRYGHLILGENGENGYTIGVPYRYLPALKEEAESQGFQTFRSIRGSDAGYGEYGYWMRDF